MKRNKTDNYQALLIAGFIIALFGLLITIGLIYRPQFINIGTDVKISPSHVQTSRELGVQRIQKIMEGDFAELKTLNDSKAFCQLNIEGKPEDYSDHWNQFFSKLQQKKKITITGWHFQMANPSNSDSKTNVILGVSLQYVPN